MVICRTEKTAEVEESFGNGHVYFPKSRQGSKIFWSHKNLTRVLHHLHRGKRVGFHLQQQTILSLVNIYLGENPLKKETWSCRGTEG